MLQLAAPRSGGPNDQDTVGDGVGDSFELLRVCQQVRGANGRARFVKSDVVRVHDPEAAEAEVAHGASGSTDVKRVARGHQHDVQAIEFSTLRQEWNCTTEIIQLRPESCIEKPTGVSAPRRRQAR